MKALLLCLLPLSVFSQNLADSLGGICYRINESYYFETSTLLDVIGQFNTPGPSSFDLNGDQYVDTQDLLIAVGAYGTTAPPLDLTQFVPFDDFGEGNTWCTYIGTDPSIIFGWLHRTPFDETTDPNYLGYDVYTYTFDLVTTGGTFVHYFVQ